MSTAQLSRAAASTASASSAVPGITKGTRGSSPKKAASVEIGRKGSPVLARIVACAACACTTAIASGRARYSAQCMSRSLEGAAPAVSSVFPSRSILTTL